MPDNIFSFLVDGYATLKAEFPDKTWARLCGLIIAAPFELWNWHELAGVPASDFAAWRRVSFQDEAAQITNLPVDVVNDATAACRAEHVFGRGRNFRDYVYFFIGAFIGAFVGGKLCLTTQFLKLTKEMQVFLDRFPLRISRESKAS